MAARERARVRERRAPPALRLARLDDDEGLRGRVGAHEVDEGAALAALEALEVGDDDTRVGIAEEVVDVLGDADVGGVAHRDELAEAEALLARELRERERHVAA